MFHDEPLTSKTEAIIPGEDLTELGVEQLSERLNILRDEIERTQDMMEKKKTGLSQAQAFFKTPGSN